MAALKAEALAALIPPPRLSLAQWIETHLVLPAGVSAQPGRVRLWPFQYGIANAISDPEIERVTIVKPVRVGATTLFSATVGSFVANEPAPLLVLLPTEADCRDYVVSDLEPIFEATPALAGLLAQDISDVRNTILSRRFPGGSLKIVAAKAPRNLRRHNVRVLLVDECDAMESTTEGDPLTLAERRTLSFPDRKIVLASTPTLLQTSAILRAYAASDQRQFEIPCVDCGSFTFLQWRHIEWRQNQPETAAFRCPHCKELIAERHKAAMVERGVWRATAPDVKGHAGFLLNSLVSPHVNASWDKLVAEFLRVKDHADQLQVFCNTIWAEGWSAGDDAPPIHELAALASPMSLANIPAEVLWLCSGADVQGDRIECSTVGFDADDNWYVLDHRILPGSPLRDDVWHDLGDLLAERYPHPSGGTLGRDATCIDAGDGNTTDRVLSFCAGHRARFRVIPTKGMDGAGRPALTPTKSARSRSLMVLGTDPLKQRLYTRLERRTGIHFSDDLPEAYYDQLLSERPVVRYARGQPHRIFERYAGKLAEALDCMVYALAARTAIGSNAVRRTDELAGRPVAPPMPTVIRSAWMDSLGQRGY
jgi:phage terminase large subunit GpA-like protein